MGEIQNVACPKCGAPALTRICSYCGTDTGLTKDEAIRALEYPILKYKDVTCDYGLVARDIVVSALFFLLGLVFALVGLGGVIVGWPLMIYGGYCLFKYGILKPYGNHRVMKNGKLYVGLVMSYFDGEEITSEEKRYVNKQTLAVLINTDQGNQILLCPTGKVYKRYHQNTSVQVKIFDGQYVLFGERERVVPV